MKASTKRILALIPLAILLAGLAYLGVQQSGVKREIGEANGLRWGQGETQLRVLHSARVGNEVSTNQITVVDARGRTVFSSEFSVDLDLFGMIIVGAVQVDDDPERELIAWGNNVVSKPRESFYLDYADGNVERRPFKAIAARMQPLIDRYRHANQEIPMILALVLLFNLLWYFVLGVRWLFRRARAAIAGTAKP